MGHGKSLLTMKTCVGRRTTEGLLVAAATVLARAGGRACVCHRQERRREPRGEAGLIPVCRDPPVVRLELQPGHPSRQPERGHECVCAARARVSWLCTNGAK